jgi:hypothetical protein
VPSGRGGRVRESAPLSGVTSPARNRERDAGFTEISQAVERFIERPPHLDGPWWWSHPSLPWRGAREALMNDADAPVPAA